MDALALPGHNPSHGPLTRRPAVQHGVPDDRGYVVVWDLHWHALECQRLEPAADLSDAMAAAIERLDGEGWQAEATPEYGFVLLIRRLRQPIGDC